MSDQIIERAQRLLLAPPLDHLFRDAAELRPARVVVGITRLDLPLARIGQADPIALGPRRGLAHHALDAFGAARQR